MKPRYQGTHTTIYHGDCREVLASLPEQSVNCCVTSPPYFGLRDYGHDGQIGLEQTPDEYVAEMVKVFRGVKRMLRDDGTLWLNLGDSYAGSGKGSNPDGTPHPSTLTSKSGTNTGCITGKNMPQKAHQIGLKPKDLIGIPWRVAFALQQDGWYLRQDIIWHKPNPMPESVTDRCTKAHEYIFLLSKSQKYWYDAEAIKEPLADGTAARMLKGVSDDHKHTNGAPGQTPHSLAKPRSNTKKQFDQSQAGGGTNIDGHTGDRKPNGEYFDYVMSGNRNKRSVWTVNTKPYSGAHFAVFPAKLITPCILAGCPKGGVVLDPFGGSGTTGAVAKYNGRKSVLIELNEDYIAMQIDRIRQGVLDI